MVASQKSTNVRSFNREELPAMAALFFRPRNRLQVPSPQGSEPLETTFKGLKLRGWSMGRGPSVLLVHGWEGAAGQLAAIAEALVRLGFRAVAFDMPAHGSSEGAEASVRSFADAAEEIARTFGPFVGAVGHSMGGASVGVANLEVQRKLLIAAAATPEHFIRVVSNAMLPPELHAGFAEAVWKHAGFTVESVHTPTHVAKFVGPVRVLHDPADREVPFAHARAIASAGAHVSLRELDGAGHVRILSDARTLGEVAELFAPLAQR